MNSRHTIFIALSIASAVPAFAQSTNRPEMQTDTSAQSANQNAQQSGSQTESKGDVQAQPDAGVQSDMSQQNGSITLPSARAVDTQSYKTALGEVAPLSKLEPQNENGVTYLCGGIGIEERQKLKKVASNYDLKLTFATRSGEYLADVKVDIADANGNAILKTNCNAPLLYVDFAKKGTYHVNAETGGYELKKIARVQGKDQKTASVVMAWPTQMAESAEPSVTSTGGSNAGESPSESGGSETVPNE